MASREKVLDLFDVSGLRDDYTAYAQQMLYNDAESNGRDDMPDADECGDIGDTYVKFWCDIFMREFTDAEIDDLLAMHQKPVFRKLMNLEEKFEPLIEKFFADRLVPAEESSETSDEEPSVAGLPLHKLQIN